MMNDLKTLHSKLRTAWSESTSSDPDNWTPGNPAWGQCAVTACVVQDLFGGTIVWAEAKLPNGQKISHYFNKINGSEVDLTVEQFPEGTVIPKGAPKTKEFASTRDYVLSYPQTAQRYSRLKTRMEQG